MGRTDIITMDIMVLEVAIIIEITIPTALRMIPTAESTTLVQLAPAMVGADTAMVIEYIRLNMNNHRGEGYAKGEITRDEFESMKKEILR